MPLRPREGPGLGGKGVMVNHFGDLQNWWEDEIILLLDLKMMVSENDLFLRKKEWADVFGKVFFIVAGIVEIGFLGEVHG